MVIVSQLPFAQVPPRAIPKEMITPPLQEMNEFKATLNGFKGAQCPEADHRIPASHPSHQPEGRSDVWGLSDPLQGLGRGRQKRVFLKDRSQ